MRDIVLVILGLAVFSSAIGVVMARHDTRRLFVEIQQMEKRRDSLREEWGRLQLEQSTWATDVRIEAISRTELNMIEPEPSSVMLFLE